MDSSDITDIANRLLRLDPDPAPRVRILRDLLDRPAIDPEVRTAVSGVRRSRWVRQLVEEQRDDGGWGRFHSMDSRSKHRVRTTEQAVDRALSLGLTAHDPVLHPAVDYLERLLHAELPFPDPAERNDRWPAGCELFVASTLADIDPGNPSLEPTYDRWLRIAEQSFASGGYSADDELAAHVRLTGATTMRGSYLILDNRYAVSLLGHVQGRLGDATEGALVEWLLSGPGLGYVGVPPQHSPHSLRGKRVGAWLRTQLILSRFRSWPTLAGAAMESLVALRDQAGLWDLGPGTFLQISESWRRPVNRRIDSSVFALLLLKRWLAARR